MSDVNAGFLKVGSNEQDEIVINHPDLKPDENGVGRIISRNCFLNMRVAVRGKFIARKKSPA